MRVRLCFYVVQRGPCPAQLCAYDGLLGREVQSDGLVGAERGAGWNIGSETGIKEGCVSRVSDPKAKIALLRAAEQTFAEHGVADAKVEDIAKSAGLSADAFYLHFESKEGALEQIVQAWLGRCTSLFAPPADYPETPNDPHSMLDFCIERDVQLWEFFWNSRTTMRVLQACHGEYAYLIEAFREEMQRRNRQWFDRWRQDGFIRPDVDPELAATLLGGAYEQLSLKMARSETRPPLERWLEFAQETFVRAFGTPELVAALERRYGRTTTGVHEVQWSLLRDGSSRARL